MLQFTLLFLGVLELIRKANLERIVLTFAISKFQGSATLSQRKSTVAMAQVKAERPTSCRRISRIVPPTRKWSTA